MKQILTVVGARPQIIKSAALSRCIQTKFNSALKETLVHTGQHYSANMSALHFEQMGLRQPDVILDLEGLVNPASRLSFMINELGKSIEQYKPDYVLVYGDTDSTLAAALAAEMHQVPIAHVEAGLRSHRRDMPEERNRILTDHLSQILFAPTPKSQLQLEYEMRQRDCKIVLSGDIMLDNALHYRKEIKQPTELAGVQGPFALFTAHRADTMESETRFLAMCKAVEIISEQYQVVWPMHPRTRNQMQKWMGESERNALLQNARIHCLEPMGYLETLWSLEYAALVCTDSGGLQKEAAFYGKPVIILREETEWTELIDLGFASLTGLEESLIKKALHKFSTFESQEISTLFGNGSTSELICQTLVDAR